ncbi:endonuclease III [Brachybacterium halotolerans subsp. kimchii]|uniref:endonuclease III domain-containing protein n=1 Tax=Brachybacterium halotolerans TaxID=2795215 RepID=UPI001E399740|nr:endonuclease III [Brachybacterium halotolerans]UEJ84131.1 endonuclease III [Brachybacterium halotolerans subsp. kimchii]
MSGVSSADGPADVREVVSRLRAEHPRARTELDFRDAFELLVATVLSAQTTDARVNSVTPELFGRWPGPEGLAGADPAEVEKVLKPLGMGPTRAARVIALARALLADHGGEVPDDQDALEALPGVGRKTAFVVRGVHFGRSLLAVDTHVARVAGRLGWTRSRQARTVEHDVVALVQSADAAAEERDAEEGDAAAETSDPTTDLTALSLRLILHGRRVCIARSPHCAECALADLCPRIGVAA